MESELKMSRGGFPPLSARGCVQSLTPIKLGNFHRTINGKLIYNTPTGSKKYCSRIVCHDKSAFASEGLWVGEEVGVACIQRLIQKFSGSKVNLERIPVNGSVKVIAAAKTELKVVERKVVFERPAEGFISYRPVLQMRITDMQLKTDEWGLKAQWQLDLEEI